MAGCDKYLSQLQDDFYQRRGIYTLDSRSYCVGEFNHGKMDESVSYTSVNGDSYNGEFKDNKRTRQGAFCAKDGSELQNANGQAARLCGRILVERAIEKLC